MKKVLGIVGLFFAAFLAIAIITATPLVGEVVTLHTLDADGEWQTTPLWVVDFENASYLRAGTPDGSGWVTRLQANPQVKLERSGSLETVRLVEEPAQLSAVHQKMSEKYGWADDFVGLMGGDRALSLALRIEAVSEPPRHP
jgi:hypothetical protein